MIVHGQDGLDEITLNGETHIAEVTDGNVRLFQMSPKDFGLEQASLVKTRRSSPDASAYLIRSILSCECDELTAVRLVLINSAAPIYLAGKARTLVEAVEKAKDSLSSGSALLKLNDLIEATN